MSAASFKSRVVTATNGLLRDSQGTGSHPIQFDVHERRGVASVTIVLLYGTREYRAVVDNTAADDVLNAVNVLFAFAAPPSADTMTVFSSNIAALSAAPVAMIARAALLEEDATDIRAELARLAHRSIGMVAAQHHLVRITSAPTPNPIVVDLTPHLVGVAAPTVLLLKVVQNNGNNPLGHTYADFTFAQASAATPSEKVIWAFRNFQYFSVIPSLVVVPWRSDRPPQLHIQVANVQIDGTYPSHGNQNWFEVHLEGALQWHQ